MQVKEGTGVNLNCPGYKCNELISSDWIDIIFKDDHELSHRMQTQRTHRVIDVCSELKSCSGRDCNEIIYGISGGSGSSGGSGGSGDDVFNLNNIARGVMCNSGHIFCLLCNEENHSPASCSEYQSWTTRVSSLV